MRVITRTADQVRDLRRALSLTQKEFAARLQVSRRTIIRGEQRGLEIPWYSTSDMRIGLHKLWGDLEMEAADRAARGKRVRVPPLAPAERDAAGSGTRGLTVPRAGSSREKVSPARIRGAAAASSAIAKVSRPAGRDTHGAPRARKVSPSRRPRRRK